MGPRHATVSSVHREDSSGVRMEARGNTDSSFIGLGFRTYGGVELFPLLIVMPLTGSQLHRNKSSSLSATGVNKEKNRVKNK